MSDEQIFQLLDELEGAPSIVDGTRRHYYVPGRVVTFTRVGKGERWALSPSRGVTRLEGGMVTQERAWMFSLEALRWVYRAARMDFAAHARAMSARVL